MSPNEDIPDDDASIDSRSEISARGAHRRRIRRRRAAVIAGALTVALVGAAAVAVARLDANVSTAPIRPSSSSAPTGDEQADAADDGDLNVLLLGSDSRDLSDETFGVGDGTKRSDAMVLAHFAADRSRIDAIQLPRDTLVDLPVCDDLGDGARSAGRGMLNSALNNGPACSVAAVEALTGVRIDHFMELDFEGFERMVDALGGVDVCLPEPLSDGHAQLDLPAGPQIVDGAQALALARTRHALADGSDISRLGHQQMVMSAIVQEATRTDVLTNPVKLYSFLDAATSSTTVDPGLAGIPSLISLATRAAQVPLSQIVFLTMPWEPAPGDANRVVASADAGVVFRAVADDVPIILAGDDTAAVPDRSAPIAVLNGSGVAGLAASVGDEAAALGYTVAVRGNADAALDVTRLVADAGVESQETAANLALELGVPLSVEVGETHGVQLLLGADYEELPRETAEEPLPSRPIEATSRGADVDLCAA
ncbi:LCP family protein [Microbacterium sp.]|uniref:LCP family protein n=1 Tax=Microbacterium sp. TaxID=51671 RepID=UPI0028993A03|nr:LCP family protein [Microbacterium sp.]